MLPNHLKPVLLQPIKIHKPSKVELFPSHITLNGQQTSIDSLLTTSQKTESWEAEWLEFIKEWYNSSSVIKVQTSGSTGTPKSIQLKKEFVAASALRTIHFFNLQEGDQVLHCLPSRYIAGKLMLVRALLGKLDLIAIDPASDFSILQNTKFKFAAMVVNQVHKVLQLPRESCHLDYLLIGGSAVPLELEEKLQTINTACYSSYAMTETATHIALRKLNGNSLSSYYHCLEGISVALSEQACLQIHMPGLEHKFLQTTDLAELKDNKSFRILGRADHVIISGGIKFSPEQLEKKLEPFISQPFFISSLPHEILGQQLILMIEGKADSLLEQAIQKTCEQHLTKYEQPKLIRFINQLPRTENGKLKR